jgi:hypothetical protein
MVMLAVKLVLEQQHALVLPLFTAQGTGAPGH